MKKRCKDIDITDANFIESAIQDWKSHRTRKDMTRSDVRRLYRHFGGDKEIARELSQEIKEKKLRLSPVRVKERIDSSNGKTRTLCVESAKQQMLGYVAIKGLQPVIGRIGEYQCTCIPGRGTIWGVKQIMRWNEDEKIRWTCQVDIVHNYASITPEMIGNFLSKYIGNGDLVWLIVTLIETNPLGGLPIGSALSVYLDALYLSQAYHYIMEGMYKERRGKRIPLVKHTLFFVDDIAMYTSSERDAKLADRMLRKYMQSIGLKLHDKKRITKITDKSYQDMLGFREYRDHVTIRRRDYIKLKAAIREMEGNQSIKSARRLVSMNGFIRYSNSYRFRKKYRTKETMKKARRYISKYEKGNF